MRRRLLHLLVLVLLSLSLPLLRYRLPTAKGTPRRTPGRARRKPLKSVRWSGSTVSVSSNVDGGHGRVVLLVQEDWSTSELTSGRAGHTLS